LGLHAGIYYPISDFTSFFLPITATTSFAHLKILELQLTLDHAFEDDLLELAEALQHLINLEGLFLSMLIFDSCEEGSVDLVWTTIFNTITLPNLRKLELHGGMTHHEMMLGFFARHSNALRFLQIYYIRLIHSPFSWIKIMKGLAKTFALDHLVIFTDRNQDEHWGEYRDVEVTWEGSHIPWTLMEDIGLDVKGAVDQQLRHAIDTLTIKTLCSTVS
jgi:hypothetical protein